MTSHLSISGPTHFLPLLSLPLSLLPSALSHTKTDMILTQERVEERELEGKEISRLVFQLGSEKNNF